MFFVFVLIFLGLLVDAPSTLEKFSPIISSNIYSTLIYLPSFSETSMICNLDCFILPHRFCTLWVFFSFFLFSLDNFCLLFLLYPTCCKAHRLILHLYYCIFFFTSTISIWPFSVVSISVLKSSISSHLLPTFSTRSLNIFITVIVKPFLF